MPWGRFLLQALYVIVFEILPTFISNDYKPMNYHHKPRLEPKFKLKPVARPKPTRPFGKFRK